MGSRKDSFAAAWRRVLADPLLPRLQAAQRRGDVLTWYVRDGRIVIEPTDDDTPFPRARLHETELPVASNRLIGRASDCALLLEELEAHRLVTITGPAGVGKTRLALEIATELDTVFGDGAVWVDLSGTTEPDLVAIDVAARLGVQQGSVRFFAASDQPEEEPPFFDRPADGSRERQPAGERPFEERLAAKLRERQMLLVLDNAEHVLDGAVALAEAIQSVCPEVHVLCTSREPLGAQGEWLHPLRPLTVPTARPARVEEALASDAVDLFLERAHPAVQTPRSDADLLLAVAICQRLGGVPYAIELAAAQAGTVPLRQILDRLDHSDVTAGSASTETMISWSYHLLPPPQQLLLRRLSVFRGGFRLDAAADVCAGKGYPRARIRRTLAPLLDSPLLQRMAYHSPPRFALKETTREYAAAQLAASGDADRMRGRHRRWYLRLVEQIEPRLRGRDQIEALDLLESELDNIRAALEFHTAEEAAESLRISCALERFWVRGYVQEGRVHLGRALVHTRSESARPRGLAVASELANFAGDFNEGRRHGEEARRLARRVHDRMSEAVALQQLSVEAHERGRLAEAELLGRVS